MSRTATVSLSSAVSPRRSSPISMWVMSVSALLMEAVGLSMAMGTFLAGVMLSGSSYRHQVEADVEPFKGLLMGLFFLAVGMSLDLAVVAQNWQLIAIYVVAYMIASYGLFGIFASVAVIINVILILSIMSIMGATLTLPGIAGIVLTVGTAVDANVIIYERIREELRAGKRVIKAIDDGFSEAMSAIIDANVTSFISAMVMFFLGSGPVKGFAVTLTIGIATSVFTAIFLTRLMIVFWLEWRKPKQLVL